MEEIIKTIIMNYIQQNMALYQNGQLYEKEKNYEMDEVVRKFRDFGNSYYAVWSKYPEERNRLVAFLMIDYAIRHGLIN